MGILDNFEKGLERAVNGAFAKTFKSGLQPVEIGSALKRELDTKAAIVSRDRILVPNDFEVRLGSSDFERMSGIGPTLIDDLVQIVEQHAATQGFQFAGGVTVTLVQDARLTPGLLEVASSTVQREVTWNPVLDVAGKRHPIIKARTVIGRGRDADIVVEDTGISRRHLEILWDGTTAEAHDLDSTNGSQLAGQRFSRVILEPDSVIQIGRTRIVFRVLAQSASVDQFADLRQQAPVAGEPGDVHPVAPRPTVAKPVAPPATRRSAGGRRGASITESAAGSPGSPSAVPSPAPIPPAAPIMPAAPAASEASPHDAPSKKARRQSEDPDSDPAADGGGFRWNL